MFPPQGRDDDSQPLLLRCPIRCEARYSDDWTAAALLVAKLAAPIYVFRTPDPKLLLADPVGEHSAGKRATSGVSGQRWVS